MGDGQSVGLIGLGSMGYGMACQLAAAGLETYGFDVAAERMAQFRENGGRPGELADVARAFDTLVLVVVNAAQMEDVLFGATGVATHMSAGAVVMGCATVAPDAARAIAARLAEHDLLYLDAPISGGAVKAASGELTIMASGPPQAFARARPALDAMAQTVFELGDEVGTGSMMKIVNQLLAGVHIASTAEAMTFAAAQGIAPARTLEVLSQCAGTSWMFENRGPHIAKGDYTPHSTVEIFVKDLGIVCDVARGMRFPAVLASNALTQFLAAAGMGLGREDDSAVAKVYARLSGTTLPGDDGWSADNENGEAA